MFYTSSSCVRSGPCPAGNPCEAQAPEALRAIASALQRNRVASQGGPRQGGEENLMQLLSPVAQGTASPKPFCRVRLEDPSSAGLRRSWQSGVEYEPMTPMHAALERAATGAAGASLEYRCDLPHEAHITRRIYYHIVPLLLLVRG
jgi:hypothetical protein